MEVGRRKVEGRGDNIKIAGWHKLHRG
jgi:hypothetical protein